MKMVNSVRAVLFSAAVIAVAGVGGCSDKASDESKSVAGPFSLNDQSFEAFLSAAGRSHVQGEQREKLNQEWRQKTLFAKRAHDAGLDRDSAYLAKLAQFQRETLAQAYVDYELKRRLKDDELKALYEQRKDGLKRSSIHLGTVFFPGDDRAKADEFVAKVAAGEAFQSAIQGFEPSPDPLEPNGDRGWMPADHAAQRYPQEVLEGESGAVFGPIQRPDGWLVVTVLEAKADRVPEFDKVRHQLMQQERARIVKQLEAEALTQK